MHSPAGGGRRSPRRQLLGAPRGPRHGQPGRPRPQPSRPLRLPGEPAASCPSRVKESPSSFPAPAPSPAPSREQAEERQHRPCALAFRDFPLFRAGNPLPSFPRLSRPTAVLSPLPPEHFYAFPMEQLRRKYFEDVWGVFNSIFGGGGVSLSATNKRYITTCFED